METYLKQKSCYGLSSCRSVLCEIRSMETLNSADRSSSDSAGFDLKIGHKKTG